MSKNAGLPLFSDLEKKERELLHFDICKRDVRSQKFLRKLWHASKKAQPTLYHLLLQYLHQRGILQTTFTFNIDHLEHLAANLPIDKVHQLHGTLHKLHCGACHSIFETTLDWVTKLDVEDAFIHDCVLSRRYPRKAHQSIRNLHFHVQMYGNDPCTTFFQNDLRFNIEPESASVLIIAGCSMRTNEQKQMVTDLIKKMDAVGGNVIYINPILPPLYLRKSWGSTVLYLQMKAEIFAGKVLKSLFTVKEPVYLETPSLFVQPSTIPNAGQGLFTSRFIPANTCIMTYKGEYIDKQELERRYGDCLAVYTIKVHENLYIDACDPLKSNSARFINTIIDDNDGALQFNVTFELQHNGQIGVRTLKDILQGQELFVDYGDEYNVT